MHYFTYILKMADKRYYIGQTNNLEKRIFRHQTGQVRATKGFRPVELVYSEKFSSRSESVIRERYLKSLKSHKMVEKIIHSGDGPVV